MIDITNYTSIANKSGKKINQFIHVQTNTSLQKKIGNQKLVKAQTPDTPQNNSTLLESTF